MTAANSISGRHGQHGNLRVALLLALLVAGMAGLSFAAVPLYQIFCQVTGYGGTTQKAETNGKGVIDRIMGVRFDATVSSGVPIRVRAAESVSDEIGTIRTVTYLATNLTSRELATTASFNVVPEIAGSYFNKIECFCFTEQVIGPGETVEMPVTFFVDPDIADNNELDTIRDITLSYTFYQAK